MKSLDSEKVNNNLFDSTLKKIISADKEARVQIEKSKKNLENVDKIVEEKVKKYEADVIKKAEKTINEYEEKKKKELEAEKKNFLQNNSKSVSEYEEVLKKFEVRVTNSIFENVIK